MTTVCAATVGVDAVVRVLELDFVVVAGGDSQLAPVERNRSPVLEVGSMWRRAFFKKNALKGEGESIVFDKC